MKNVVKASWESEYKRVVSLEKDFVPLSPACLNCTPDGFKPGPIMSFFPMTAANFDYWLADKMIFPFYNMGLNTPNKITLFNSFVRVYLTWNMYAVHNYPLVIALLIFAQVLDCADGQMARRYKMGSEFGAWFDHFSDELFGYYFATTLCYIFYQAHGLQVSTKISEAKRSELLNVRCRLVACCTKTRCFQRAARNTPRRPLSPLPLLACFPNPPLRPSLANSDARRSSPSRWLSLSCFCS